MYCPHCKKLNKCFCSNCNKNSETEGVIIIDREHNMYRCYFCGELFHEQDSADYEWDMMIERFAREISPDDCLDWWEYGFNKFLKNFKEISYIEEEKKRIKKLKEKYGEFALEQAFKIHFKYHPDNINWEIFYKLKRENTINKLL
jgi:hypothetical protein